MHLGDGPYRGTVQSISLAEVFGCLRREFVDFAEMS